MVTRETVIDGVKAEIDTLIRIKRTHETGKILRVDKQGLIHITRDNNDRWARQVFFPEELEVIQN